MLQVFSLIIQAQFKIIFLFLANETEGMVALLPARERDKGERSAMWRIESQPAEPMTEADCGDENEGIVQGRSMVAMRGDIEKHHFIGTLFACSGLYL